MAKLDRIFLPGTARFIALGSIAAISAAMTPATAFAESGASPNEVAATAEVVAHTTAKAEPGADNSDPRYRNLFASWKSAEFNARNNAVPATPAVDDNIIPSRMPLTSARFTSDFGMRIHPVTGRRAGHDGIDMAAPTGTPIYATADGKIEMAQWYGGYGNFVEIDHGNSMETRYGHMSKLNVSVGQEVKKGDLIGFVGSTGRSTGPHLHYEVRIAGEPVDPEPYLHADTFEEAFASSSLGAGGPE